MTQSEVDPLEMSSVGTDHIIPLTSNSSDWYSTLDLNSAARHDQLTFQIIIIFNIQYDGRYHFDRRCFVWMPPFTPFCGVSGCTTLFFLFSLTAFILFSVGGILHVPTGSIQVIAEPTFHLRVSKEKVRWNIHWLHHGGVRHDPFLVGPIRLVVYLIRRKVTHLSHWSK